MNHSTHFLYGITPQAIEDMKYYEALEYKKQQGQKLYKTLYEMRRNDREDVRMHYVAKALKHTQRLLDEMTMA